MEDDEKRNKKLFLKIKKSGLHKPLFFGKIYCDYANIDKIIIIASPNIIHPTVLSSKAKLISHSTSGIPISTINIAHTIVRNILVC